MIKIRHTPKIPEITRPAKAGAFYIVTTVMTKAIALFAAPVFTRLLRPYEYGTYSLYLSLSGILSVVMLLGITGGAIYRALGKFKDDEDEIISGALSVLFLAASLLFTITALFWKTATSITGLAPLFNFLLIFEAFLSNAQSIVFAFLRYRYSYLKICIVNLLYALLSTGAGIILIYITPLRAEARIFASFGATLFLTLPLIKGFIKPNIKARTLKYVLKLSLPLLPSALSMTLIAQSDKLIIKHYHGTGDLGKYSIAYSVGFMLTSLTAALYSALQPWLMRKLNARNLGEARKLSEKIIFLSSLLLIVFLLLCHEIFTLLAAEEYREAEIAVYPLAVAGYFQFLSNLVGINIIYSEKTYAISAFGIISFLLNALFNIILIPKFSYTAAAVSTALSYAILALLEYLFIKHKKLESIVSARSVLYSLLSVAALPIYYLSSLFMTRAILALSVTLIALPSIIFVVKMLLEKQTNTAIFN